MALENSYDLIIFDCDGTLVDSEYLNNKVCGDVLRDFGLSEYTTEKCFVEFSGRSWTEIRQILEDRHELEIPDQLIQDYIKGVDEQRGTLLKTIPHALETAARCGNKTKICVGSNGERTNVLKSLEQCGFMDIFTNDTIFTKIQVERPKPHPDLFLFAAEQMGVAPSKCLVIEDSPTGVRAGIAAEMDVWGFVACSHDPDLQKKHLKESGATLVFDNFIHISDQLGH